MGTLVATPGIQHRREDRRRITRGYSANRQGYDARRRAHTKTQLDKEFWDIVKRDPCGMCGLSATDNRLAVSDVDHIENLDDGGVDSWENYSALCAGCNRGVKRDRTLLTAMLLLVERTA